MKGIFRIWLGLLPVLLMLWAPQAPAAPQQTEPLISSDQPIEISSQQLEAWQAERKSVFTGEVVARQGDMTLWTDQLSVYFNADQSQVDRMEAEGQVRIKQLDRTARAERAVYRREAGTLVLSGNAEVSEGDNRIAGEEITLYIEDNRSLVKGSPERRVEAIIIPQQGPEEP